MAQIKTTNFIYSGMRSYDPRNIGGTLVIPVLQDESKKPQLGRSGKTLDSALKGRLSRAMDADKYTGAKGATLVLSGTNDHSMAERVVLFGVGNQIPKDVASLERMGGDMAVAFMNYNAGTVNILADGQFSLTAAHHLALGVNLRHYHWTKSTDAAALEKQNAATDLYVAVYGTSREVATLNSRFTQEAGIIVPSVHLARTLVNRRANDLNTQQLEDAAVYAAKEAGLEVQVLRQHNLEDHKMGAILAVGQASPNKPRIVVIRYNGNPDSKEKIALIGKGLVYDTGGLSIKPTEGMIDMNCDMGGAATALGAMMIAAKSGVKANIVAVLGIAENSLGSNSYRPGDILTTMSGKTVEVGNTDAEGRLVLADCITYAQKILGATTLIEASTLTGAAMIALGHSYAGVMSQDDRLIEIIKQASANTGDPVWHLPMNSDIDAMLKSPTGHADMFNIGSPARMAGASVGAHFLQRFVEEGSSFAHLDIAPVAWMDKPWGVTTSGGTGLGVRLMAEATRLLSRGR